MSQLWLYTVSAATDAGQTQAQQTMMMFGNSRVAKKRRAMAYWHAEDRFNSFLMMKFSGQLVQAQDAYSHHGLKVSIIDLSRVRRHEQDPTPTTTIFHFLDEVDCLGIAFCIYWRLP